MIKYRQWWIQKGWKVVLVLLLIRFYRYVYLKHRHSFDFRSTVYRN